MEATTDSIQSPLLKFVRVYSFVASYCYAVTFEKLRKTAFCESILYSRVPKFVTLFFVLNHSFKYHFFEHTTLRLTFAVAIYGHFHNHLRIDVLRMNLYFQALYRSWYRNSKLGHIRTSPGEWTIHTSAFVSSTRYRNHGRARSTLVYSSLSRKNPSVGLVTGPQNPYPGECGFVGNASTSWVIKVGSAEAMAGTTLIMTFPKVPLQFFLNPTVLFVFSLQFSSLISLFLWGHNILFTRK